MHEDRHREEHDMKLYLIRHTDLMTGFQGFTKVRADSLAQAKKMFADAYPDYVIED